MTAPVPPVRTALDDLLDGGGAAPSTALDDLVATSADPWAHPTGAGGRFAGPPSLLSKIGTTVRDVATGVVTAPIHDAFDALLTPVQGSTKPTTPGRGGWPGGVRPADAGAVITAENTPGSITPERQRDAAMNTTVNAMLPEVYGGAEAVAARTGLTAPLQRLAARAATGAVGGAYYDPEHPLQGAAIGIGIGEALHAPLGIAHALDRIDQARARVIPEGESTPISETRYDVYGDPVPDLPQVSAWSDAVARARQTDPAHQADHAAADAQVDPAMNVGGESAVKPRTATVPASQPSAVNAALERRVSPAPRPDGIDRRGLSQIPDDELLQRTQAHHDLMEQGGSSDTDERLALLLQSELDRRGLVRPSTPSTAVAPRPQSTPAPQVAPQPVVEPPPTAAVSSATDPAIMQDLADHAAELHKQLDTLSVALPHQVPQITADLGTQLAAFYGGLDQHPAEAAVVIADPRVQAIEARLNTLPDALHQPIQEAYHEAAQGHTAPQYGIDEGPASVRPPDDQSRELGAPQEPSAAEAPRTEPGVAPAIRFGADAAGPDTAAGRGAVDATAGAEFPAGQRHAETEPVVEGSGHAVRDGVKYFLTKSGTPMAHDPANRFPTEISRAAFDEAVGESPPETVTRAGVGTPPVATSPREQFLAAYHPALQAHQQAHPELYDEPAASMAPRIADALANGSLNVSRPIVAQTADQLGIANTPHAWQEFFRPSIFSGGPDVGRDSPAELLRPSVSREAGETGPGPEEGAGSEREPGLEGGRGRRGSNAQVPRGVAGVEGVEPGAGRSDEESALAPALEGASEGGRGAGGAGSLAYPEHPVITATPSRGGKLAFNGNPKWRTTPTDALETYHQDLLDRIERLVKQFGDNVVTHVRQQDTGEVPWVGTIWKNAGGRALAGLNQVDRILPVLEAELKGRYNGMSDDELARGDVPMFVTSGDVTPDPWDVVGEGAVQEAVRDYPDFVAEHGTLAEVEIPDVPAAPVETPTDKLHQALTDLTSELRAQRTRTEPVAEPAVHDTYQGPPSTDESEIEFLHAGPAGLLQPLLPMESIDAVQQAFLPVARSAQAKVTGDIIRSQNAQRAWDLVVGETQRKAFGKMIGRLPQPEQFAIDNAIELGTKTGHPDHDAAIAQIRHDLDTERDAIRALGTGKLKEAIENYLPHIWKDPVAAKSVIQRMLAKRPLQGSKSFLKKRTILTMQEGVDAGLQPVSWNPVDLANLKLREMRRYRMAEQIKAELKDRGLTRFVRSGDELPEGYAYVNDPSLTVYGGRDVPIPASAQFPSMTAKMAAQGKTVPTTVPVPGMRIMGRYALPEAAAKVLSNFLSPGLRGNALYDSYMSIGTTMNQAQLGMSAFHAGMTTAEQVISQNALAIGKLLDGKPVAAARLAVTSPLAPVTQIAKGWRLARDYKGGVLTPMVDALLAGGGRVEPEYQPEHLRQFTEAIHVHDGLAALKHFLPAMTEAITKPIMEHLVPLQKLGVFSDLAQREMARLPPGASVDDVRAAMGRAWDSVDNRVGQVVYDNLFWNKAAKDLLHASVRSVGWNWGTWRELGGGAADWARLTTDLAAGRKPTITPRMEYALALPITVGLIGALWTYLATGKPPQEMKDYFYPKTGGTDASGDPERVQLPTYMRDVFSYGTHPVLAVEHKLNPLLSAVADMLGNKDYYGDEIRNPDDPAYQQFKQLGDFAGDQFLPFSLTNTREQMKRGASMASVIPNAVGVSPAPRDMVRTRAENALHDILARHRGEATPEEAAKRNARSSAFDAARKGDTASVADALEAGDVTRTQLKHERQTTARRLGVFTQQFKTLQLPDAERVYALADSAERHAVNAALWTKRKNARRKR